MSSEKFETSMGSEKWIYWCCICICFKKELNRLSTSEVGRTEEAYGEWVEETAFHKDNVFLKFQCKYQE